MERMSAAEYRKLWETKQKKPSKYRSERTEVDGITFDSRLEANYYCELKMLQRAGEVTDIQLQPKFPLVDGKKKITYVADFLVTYADGRQEIVDVKGVKTAVYRLKKKLFEEKYPHLTIKEVEG